MQLVQRVTNVRIDFNVPRANINVLNRGKPLEQRPVINYVPVDATVDFIKSDTMIEQSLALVNSSNIISNITDTKDDTAGKYGIRSMQVYYAPTQSNSYNGLLDLKSGVLTSYTLQGGVSEPIRGSFGLQFLDMSGSVNMTSRDSSTYTAGLIKPENQSLTGFFGTNTISLTGFGLTGVNVQSFALNVGFEHSSVLALGQRFPKERPLTNTNASFQCQGFFEGINNSFTGLNYLQCGSPSHGIIALTMSPSCSTSSPSTITMINPYLENFSIDSQVGNFSSFNIAFSLPIGSNPAETSVGSVLILN